MNGSDWRLILKGKAHDSFRRGSILDWRNSPLGPVSKAILTDSHTDSLA
jgi:hypothetical protein